VRRLSTLGTFVVACAMLAPLPAYAHDDLGMGPGTASEPSHPAHVQRAATTATLPEESGYRASGVTIDPLPHGMRPYETSDPIPLAGFGIVDDAGVRMFRVPGDDRLWDHPAGQAQYVLANLNSYRLTHDTGYLDRALANARRLVDRRVESGDAWFYPYPFDWHLRDTTEVAPWYSAIAQGQSLSAFVRLYEVTGDEQWRTAADATFNSLAQAPAPALPFVSWVDSVGHLWLEEYPQPDLVSSERVLNGHMFASFGVADYWALTHDPRAAAIFDGATTSVLQTALTEFRHVGAPSSYSLRHHRSHPAYHQTHVLQFRYLYQLTHLGAFIAFANAYRTDYPQPRVGGQGRLTRKVHRLYRVDRGAAVASRRIDLKKKRFVRFDSRLSVPRHGTLVRISSGKFAGWYVKERYGRAWIGSPTDVHPYAPRKVTVGFRPGTYVGYRYSSSGKRIATRTLRVGVLTTAPSGRSAIVGGQSAFEFTSGTWSGYWVPLQSGMVFS
jgi:hypothetical protein